MKKKCYFLAVLATLVSGMNAETPDHDVELHQIEVNADRAKMYSGLGRIVNIIERQEIERAAVRSIDDLLDYVAGVDVRQRGMHGVQADVSIRGGSFDQILILLNGVNITDPQTGHYNMDIPLDLADVSRVEVLQGSAARLLGPNAFSGAINIITNENTPSNIAAQTSAGSFGFLSNGVTGNLSSEAFSVLGSLSHKRSDGHLKNTDFNIGSGYLRAALKTPTVGHLGVQMGYQQKSFGANSFYSVKYPNQFEHTKTLFAAADWHVKLQNWHIDAQLYWRRHHDRFELFRNFEGAEAYPWYKGHNHHQTDVMGGKSTVSYLWKYGKTSLGLDMRNEHIYSNVLGLTMDNPVEVPFERGVTFTKEAYRLLSSAFADHSIVLGRWYASAGVAATHSPQFGTNVNGGIDLAYRLTEVSRIFAAANSAVRLPTFTDLYYQSATEISNPNLQPEQSLTMEIGTKINPDDRTLFATAFYRIGNNIIDRVKAPENEKWESRNLTNVNAVGLETGYEHRFQHILLQSVGVNYAFVHLDKKAEGYDSKYALDYLKHKLVFNLHHRLLSKLSAHWSVGWFDRSGSYTNYVDGKIVDYKPYWMLNAKLLWKSNRLTLFTEINNLLHRKYVEFGGLEQPGIHFYTGIRVSVN